jgi:hypothetical protein
MKNVSVLVSGCFISFLLFFTSNMRAGQVITDGIKTSARMDIDKEKPIEIGKCPSPSNTLPSFYICNNSSRTILDSLLMGIAIMIMTGLSKSEKISVVERLRCQTIVAEPRLRISGLVDPVATSEMECKNSVFQQTVVI